MPSRVRILALVAACLALAGCDRPQRTIDRLRPEITIYKTDPSDATQQKIEADFTHLDTQIAVLESKGKTTDATKFHAVADNLRSDYRTARMVRTMNDAQTAIQGFGEALKDAGKSIGDAFEEVAKPTPTPN